MEIDWTPLRARRARLRSLQARLRSACGLCDPVALQSYGLAILRGSLYLEGLGLLLTGCIKRIDVMLDKSRPLGSAVGHFSHLLDHISWLGVEFRGRLRFRKLDRGRDAAIRRRLARRCGTAACSGFAISFRVTLLILTKLYTIALGGEALRRSSIKQARRITFFRLVASRCLRAAIRLRTLRASRSPISLEVRT